MKVNSPKIDLLNQTALSGLIAPDGTTDATTKKYIDDKVKKDVPADAVFTDTLYDDTGVKGDIADLQADKADKTYVDGKVKTDVPENAKFTDTTYSNATTSADGLMSKEDKIKLDGLPLGANIPSYTYVDGKDNALGRRIDMLEQMLFSDVTGHTFLIAFDDLVGIDVVNGCWNEVEQRLEC